MNYSKSLAFLCELWYYYCMNSVLKNFRPFQYSESIKILEQASNIVAPNTKNMYMVIGANGAGKSTLIANMYAKGKFTCPYINADIMKRRCPEKSDSEAMFDTMETVTSALKKGQSFVYESVFSHPSKLDFLKQAKEMGYKVHVFFVSTDNPQINVRRVAKRVQEGGHNVPPQKIIDRYYRTLALAKQAIAFCDDYYLIDNSKERSREFSMNNEQ